MTMIKLNMKKVAELEKLHMTDTIYLNTLQRMIDIAMEPQDIVDSNISHRLLAMNTLREMGVLEEPKTEKEPEQLNS